MEDSSLGRCPDSTAPVRASAEDCIEWKIVVGILAGVVFVFCVTISTVIVLRYKKKSRVRSGTLFPRNSVRARHILQLSHFSRAHWLISIIIKRTEESHFDLCKAFKFNFQLSNCENFNQSDFRELFLVANQKLRKAIDFVCVMLNKIHLSLFTVSGHFSPHLFPGFADFGSRYCNKTN